MVDFDDLERAPDWYPDPTDSQDGPPLHLRLDLRHGRSTGYVIAGDRATEIGVSHPNAKAALAAARAFVRERRWTARIRLYDLSDELWQTDEISAAGTVTTKRIHRVRH